MNRRDALKGAGSLAFASTAAAPMLAVAATLSKTTTPRLPLLQGTSDGRVLQSVDGGRTWTTVANFGSHTSVTSLQVVGSRIYAHVSVAGFPFMLMSADARTWYTVQ